MSGFGRKLPMILQSEATECGIACLAMIASYHGRQSSLATLRQTNKISLRGTTLRHIIQFASTLKLASRPLTLTLDELVHLQRPCILHWNFSHFVVLKAVGRRGITIHDPAFGVREVSFSEASAAFTGVALELWPSAGFERRNDVIPVKLSELTGHVSGLAPTLGQIFLLALALELLLIVGPFFSQWLVDDVIVSGDTGLLGVLAIGLGLLILMQQTFSFARSWIVMQLAASLGIQWRANIFAHLLRLPLQYFEKRHLGDIVSRFGSVDSIQRAITVSFVEAGMDGLMAIAVVIMMFIYSIKLGSIAIAAMLIYAAVRALWFKSLRNATEAQIIHAAKQQTHFLESMRGIKAIKLYGRESEREMTWLSVFTDQLNAELRGQRLMLVYRACNGLIFGIEKIAIFWIGGKLVIAGPMTIGAFLAFLAYKDQFEARVTSLIDKFVEFKMLGLQAERLADIVRTEPETGVHGSNDYSAQSASRAVEVSRLSYRYGDQEPFVLEDISFEIGAGEFVAIIGPSASGKTTLLNVLLGVLPPTDGEVRIDGKPLRKADIAHWRQAVGTVTQDDQLFAGTIAENIAFFDPNADRHWVEACAKVACIDMEIALMPMGYNTYVGDMGAVLSGGQKQRILIARALYKRPGFLILDEATSHLDVDSERRVTEEIGRLGITRLVVAHRPEMIAAADRSIVLIGGRVMQLAPDHALGVHAS